MSAAIDDNTITVGDDVFSSDDEKLGTITRIMDSYVVVEKGFFFPTDYYIPESDVSAVYDGKVYLTVARADALNMGWDTAPVEDAAYSGTASMGAFVDTADVADGDDLVIPLIEEELSANVRTQEAGAVRIEKRVITEDRVIDVPVTEEQIRVERRIVNRDAGEAGATAFEEIVIEVPLSSEKVELHKDARVTGEVVVSKEAVERTERVTGAVRREEVVIDETAIDSNVRSEVDERI